MARWGGEEHCTFLFHLFDRRVLGSGWKCYFTRNLQEEADCKQSVLDTYFSLLLISKTSHYLCHLLLIYYCMQRWHKHLFFRVLVYDCRLSATCDLSGLVTCQEEMSSGRQCIWFAGQDLGILVSKVITYFM